MEKHVHACRCPISSWAVVVEEMIITEKAEEALLELQFVNTNLICAMPCNGTKNTGLFPLCYSRDNDY